MTTKSSPAREVWPSFLAAPKFGERFIWNTPRQRKWKWEKKKQGSEGKARGIVTHHATCMWEQNSVWIFFFWWSCFFLLIFKRLCCDYRRSSNNIRKLCTSCVVSWERKLRLRWRCSLSCKVLVSLYSYVKICSLYTLKCGLHGERVRLLSHV